MRAGNPELKISIWAQHFWIWYLICLPSQYRLHLSWLHPFIFQSFLSLNVFFLTSHTDSCPLSALFGSLACFATISLLAFQYVYSSLLCHCLSRIFLIFCLPQSKPCLFLFIFTFQPSAFHLFWRYSSRKGTSLFPFSKMFYCHLVFKEWTTGTVFDQWNREASSSLPHINYNYQYGLYEARAAVLICFVYLWKSCLLFRCSQTFTIINKTQGDECS